MDAAVTVGDVVAVLVAIGAVGLAGLVVVGVFTVMTSGWNR